MKLQLQHFNWKNFLQRTALSGLLFLVIRIAMDKNEQSYHFIVLLKAHLPVALLMGAIFGLIHQKTWSKEEEEKEPEQFKNTTQAVLFYISFAFFIALIFLVITAVLTGIVWLLLKISGNSIQGSLWNELGNYILIVIIISVAFSIFEAIRNLRRLRKKPPQNRS